MTYMLLYDKLLVHSNKMGWDIGLDDDHDINGQSTFTIGWRDLSELCVNVWKSPMLKNLKDIHGSSKVSDFFIEFLRWNFPETKGMTVTFIHDFDDKSQWIERII